MRSWAGPSRNPPRRRKNWASAPMHSKPNCAKDCVDCRPTVSSLRSRKWSRSLPGEPMRGEWKTLRRGKLYDLAAGLPLILWFGYNAIQLRPDLAADARALLDTPDDLLANLRFFAL